MTHGLIAALRKEGHWQLTDQDARAYAAAVKNVARHYSIGATQKALDFYALSMIMMNVEGSRMVASYQLRRRRREPPPPPPGMGATAEVFEFRQPSPPPATSAAPPDAAPGNGMAAEGFTGDGIDGPIGGPAH